MCLSARLNENRCGACHDAIPRRARETAVGRRRRRRRGRPRCQRGVRAKRRDRRPRLKMSVVSWCSRAISAERIPSFLAAASAREGDIAATSTRPGERSVPEATRPAGRPTRRRQRRPGDLEVRHRRGGRAAEISMPDTARKECLLFAMCARVCTRVHTCVLWKKKKRKRRGSAAGLELNELDFRSRVR